MNTWNIKTAICLTEKYCTCPVCGCDRVGGGLGTIEVDTEKQYFKRTCHCGWEVEVKEGKE